MHFSSRYDTFLNLSRDRVWSHRYLVGVPQEIKQVKALEQSLDEERLARGTAESRLTAAEVRFAPFLLRFVHGRLQFSRA